MEKKILINLAVGGLLLGCLNSLGFTQNFEWIFWIGSWFFIGYFFKSMPKSKLFVNSFLAGFLFSLCVYLVQYLLFDMYIENNPLLKEQGVTAAEGNSPRLYLFSLGLLVSVGNGGIATLITTALSHFSAHGKKSS